MNPLDLLYIVLGIGSIIALTCLIIMTIFLVKTLISFRHFIDNADNLALGIKNGIKFKTLASLPALLIALVSKIIRKGR